MDIRKLQRAIVDGLEDVKAQNIVVFNTEHLSPLFERVIVASGTSNRQTKALAASVRDAVKSRGMEVLRTEGEDNGEWIIVDCGAAVAHIMQPSIREYYHLEEIWGGKAVKMKIDGQARSLVKASASEDDDEDDEDETPPAPAKKAARKAPAKAAPTPAAKPAPAKAPAKKAAAKKTAAKKSPARKAAAEPVGTPVRKLVVNEPARRPAAKKAAAQRPAAPPVAAKKAPARKAPARRGGA